MKNQGLIYLIGDFYKHMLMTQPVAKNASLEKFIILCSFFLGTVLKIWKTRAHKIAASISLSERKKTPENIVPLNCPIKMMNIEFTGTGLFLFCSLILSARARLSIDRVIRFFIALWV